MVNNLNNSFIPKRGPSRQAVTKAARPVYIFTLISYVLMFSALLAAGAVYMYESYINSQLEKEIVALTNDISTFSEADMRNVYEFDQRLQQAHGRVDSSVSFDAVFKLLEATTLGAVEINELQIERIEDEKLSLVAKVRTDSFDSALFQRKVHKLNNEIDQIEVANLQTFVPQLENSLSDSGLNAESEEFSVSFEAEIDILIPTVPYTGGNFFSTQESQTESIILLDDDDQDELMRGDSEEAVDNNLNNVDSL